MAHGEGDFGEGIAEPFDGVPDSGNEGSSEHPGRDISTRENNRNENLRTSNDSPSLFGERKDDYHLLDERLDGSFYENKKGFDFGISDQFKRETNNQFRDFIEQAYKEGILKDISSLAVHCGQFTNTDVGNIIKQAFLSEFFSNGTLLETMKFVNSASGLSGISFEMLKTLLYEKLVQNSALGVGEILLGAEIAPALAIAATAGIVIDIGGNTGMKAIEMYSKQVTENKRTEIRCRNQIFELDRLLTH